MERKTIRRKFKSRRRVGQLERQSYMTARHLELRSSIATVPRGSKQTGGREFKPYFSSFTKRRKVKCVKRRKQKCFLLATPGLFFYKRKGMANKSHQAHFILSSAPARLHCRYLFHLVRISPRLG